MDRTHARPALRSRLAAFVARTQQETRVPGIGVGVSIGGERTVVCAGTRAAGKPPPLGAESRYHLGCATKLLLAGAALELHRGGALRLDGTLGEYLPELSDCEHGRGVRVRHLLSHTSGYRGTTLVGGRPPLDCWQDLVRYLRQAPALFAPGTVFSYEHTESLLLAEIVRRVSSRPSLELIAATLLEPLGVVPGSFGDPADESDAGRHRFDERNGGFVPLEHVPRIAPFWLPAFSDYTVTLDELLRVAEAVSGVYSPPLLSPATVQALATSVVRLPRLAGGPLRELLPVAFGLGTAELRDGWRANTGISAGQCLGLRFDAAARMSVAVAMNATAPQLRDCILATICRDLGARTQPRESAPFALDFGDLEGRYIGPGGGIVVAHREGARMICEIGLEQRADALRAELALDGNGMLVVRSPLAQLALGFFIEPLTGSVGLMLGLSAYKRID